MGSISKIESGKYRAFARVNNKRKTKVFGRKSDARAWLEVEEKRLGADQGFTLYAAFDRYERDYSSRKRGERWEVLRLAAFKRQFADKFIIDLSRADITRWRDARLLSVSAATVNREFNLLSAVFNAAYYEWEWMRENPCKGVRRPKQPPPRKRIYTDEEVLTICDALSDGDKTKEVRLVFLIALETAMRSGEILRIKEKNVTGRVLHIPESKNGESRDVPLSKKALALIKEAGYSFTITDAVRDVLFRRALKRSGVEGATFHDSRHYAITKLAKKLNPLELARVVGHKNVNQLLTYYNEPAELLAERLDL